jgi:hypothetical protein
MYRLYIQRTRGYSTNTTIYESWYEQLATTTKGNITNHIVNGVDVTFTTWSKQNKRTGVIYGGAVADTGDASNVSKVWLLYTNDSIPSAKDIYAFVSRVTPRAANTSNTTCTRRHVENELCASDTSHVCERFCTECGSCCSMYSHDHETDIYKYNRDYFNSLMYRLRVCQRS